MYRKENSVQRDAKGFRGISFESIGVLFTISFVLANAVIIIAKFGMLLSWRIPLKYISANLNEVILLFSFIVFLLFPYFAGFYSRRARQTACLLVMLVCIVLLSVSFTQPPIIKGTVLDWSIYPRRSPDSPKRDDFFFLMPIYIFSVALICTSIGLLRPRISAVLYTLSVFLVIGSLFCFGYFSLGYWFPEREIVNDNYIVVSQYNDNYIAYEIIDRSENRAVLIPDKYCFIPIGGSTVRYELIDNIAYASEIYP